MVVSGARNLIEDISVAASSMMYAFQQLAHGAMPPSSKNEEIPHLHDHMKANFEASTRATDEVLDHVLHGLDGKRRGILGAEVLYSNNSISPMVSTEHDLIRTNKEGSDKPGSPLSSSCEIIELDASDLLAKYTHYCQVCGKGFKRDANLRMHMRAHGDEYKTNAALANPMRGGGADGGVAVGQKDASAATSAQRKYSCPQEGCRWNKKHAKFQPLKSMICVKNHYKRSHCPKMYVCNRCNYKQFAVLSDLRTHEKHCGDLKWLCSCGTTFSRKDKLMGHVTLFVGHTPVVNCFTK